MEFKKIRSDDFDYDNIAMDNSVLGDQTMASLEERLPKIPPSYYKSTQPAPYAYNPDSFSTGTGDRPTDMAYVGDTDDVSTLANDTVADRQNITKLFPSISIKKKEGNDLPDGGNTADRKAQGMVPKTSYNHQGYSNDDDDDSLKGDVVDENSSFNKLKYFIAAAFALFLIGAITALTVGFLNLQDQSASSGSTQRSFDEDRLGGEWDWTFKPTQEGSSPPTVSESPSFTPTTGAPSSRPSTSVPSSSPSTSAPSVVPTIAPTPTVPTTSPPTIAPSRSPSSAPTQIPSSNPTNIASNTPSALPTTSPSSFPTQTPSTPLPTQTPTTSPPTMSPTTSPPTRRPTFAPTMSKEETFRTVLGGASPDVLEDIVQSGSSQKEAYDWLISDPDFYSYSANRLIQRYALAVFSLKTSDNRRRLALEYSNECDWFPPQDGSAACNDEGLRENIVIRDQNIDGTLPTEIYMLAKLKTLVLTDSKLFGMLPDGIKGMKSLRKCRVVAIVSHKTSV